MPNPIYSASIEKMFKYVSQIESIYTTVVENYKTNNFAAGIPRLEEVETQLVQAEKLDSEASAKQEDKDLKTAIIQRIRYIENWNKAVSIFRRADERLRQLSDISLDGLSKKPDERRRQLLRLSDHDLNEREKVLREIIDQLQEGDKFLPQLLQAQKEQRETGIFAFISDDMIKLEAVSNFAHGFLCLKILRTWQDAGLIKFNCELPYQFLVKIKDPTLLFVGDNFFLCQLICESFALQISYRNGEVGNDLISKLVSQFNLMLQAHREFLDEAVAPLDLASRENLITNTLHEICSVFGSNENIQGSIHLAIFLQLMSVQREVRLNKLQWVGQLIKDQRQLLSNHAKKIAAKLIVCWDNQGYIKNSLIEDVNSLQKSPAKAGDAASAAGLTAAHDDKLGSKGKKSKKDLETAADLHELLAPDVKEETVKTNIAKKKKHRHGKHKNNKCAQNDSPQVEVNQVCTSLPSEPEVKPNDSVDDVDDVDDESGTEAAFIQELPNDAATSGWNVVSKRRNLKIKQEDLVRTKFSSLDQLRPRLTNSAPSGEEEAPLSIKPNNGPNIAHFLPPQNFPAFFENVSCQLSDLSSKVKASASLSSSEYYMAKFFGSASSTISLELPDNASPIMHEMLAQVIKLRDFAQELCGKFTSISQIRLEGGAVRNLVFNAKKTNATLLKPSDFDLEIIIKDTTQIDDLKNYLEAETRGFKARPYIAQNNAGIFQHYNYCLPQGDEALAGKKTPFFPCSIDVNIILNQVPKTACFKIDTLRLDLKSMECTDIANDASDLTDPILFQHEVPPPKTKKAQYEVVIKDNPKTVMRIIRLLYVHNLYVPIWHNTLLQCFQDKSTVIIKGMNFDELKSGIGKLLMRGYAYNFLTGKAMEHRDNEQNSSKNYLPLRDAFLAILEQEPSFSEFSRVMRYGAGNWAKANKGDECLQRFILEQFKNTDSYILSDGHASINRVLALILFPCYLSFLNKQEVGMKYSAADFATENKMGEKFIAAIILPIVMREAQRKCGEINAETSTEKVAPQKEQENFCIQIIKELRVLYPNYKNFQSLASNGMGDDEQWPALAMAAKSH